MKTSEIKREAEDLIKDIYWRVLESDSKEVWRVAISHIRFEVDFKRKCGAEKFIWRKVLGIMVNEYGKRFVKKS